MKKNKKNKNKGFTLVEVLGTIVILGIIALIAVPMVSASREKMNKAYYENMTYLIKVAGQDYYSDNRNLLPVEKGSKGVVNLKQLEQLKYIDSVVSTNKNGCEGYIEVSKNNGYQYKSCLKCDNYISDKNCDFKTSGGTTAPNTTYLQINPTYYEVEKGKPFVAPYASYYAEGTLIRNDIGATPNQINTNILTTYTLNYYYKNASPISIQVKVIDVTPPSAVSVVQRKESITGAIYTSGWTNSNVVQIFSATDDGSGIKGYEYSFTNTPSNSSLWTFTNKNNITQKDLLNKLGSTLKDINKTIYVRAVDNFGNKGPVASYSLAVDQTPPVCTSSGGSTTWRNTNQTITGSCSDASSKCIKNTTKVFDKSEKLDNQTPGVVTDNAGNTTTCAANQSIRVDKTPPTCVSSGGSTSWKNTNITLVGNCSDNLSGCATASVNKAITNNTNLANQSPGSIKDNAGNTAVCPANQTVKIDKTPPTCVSSGGSTSWKNTNITLVGNCSDNLSGCATASVNKAITNNTNLANQSPGSIKDNAGNTAVCPANQTVKIDKTPPTVDYNIAGGNYNYIPTVTVRGSDSNFNNMSVQVYKDGIHQTHKSVSNTNSNTHNVVLDSDGAWRIQTIVYDLAGNKHSKAPDLNGWYYQDYKISLRVYCDGWFANEDNLRPTDNGQNCNQIDYTQQSTALVYKYRYYVPKADGACEYIKDGKDLVLHCYCACGDRCIMEGSTANNNILSCSLPWDMTKWSLRDDCVSTGAEETYNACTKQKFQRLVESRTVYRWYRDS